MSAEVGSGDIVVQTARLELRRFTLDDAQMILRLLNDPGFVRQIAEKGVRDQDGARSYLREGPLASYARYGFGLWRISLRGQGTPIGMAGLLQRDYLPAPDLGYALLADYAGHGYAREAAAAALAFARDRLKSSRVLAIVKPANARSIHLLQALGFAAQGHIRPPGADADLCLFAVDPQRVPDARNRARPA